MGQGTSILALDVAKKALHECTLQGCSVEVPFDEIKEHEEKCDWRLVLCPGSGDTCKAMLPFCTIIDHVGVCTDFYDKIPRRLYDNSFYRTFVVSLEQEQWKNRNGSWKTSVHQLEGKLFFSRFAKRRGEYICDVVMGGTKEECKDYTVEASVSASASVMDPATSKSVFKASFPPRPLDKQKEAKFCLSVKQEAISDDLLWNYKLGGYFLVFKVLITKL